MPRLIDADALKRAMEEMLMSGKDAVESAYLNEVVQIVIDEAPTIEAEPVRHGRWVDMQEDDTTEGMWRCSACGNDRYFCEGHPLQHEAYYCPHCGAKMDGGAK